LTQGRPEPRRQPPGCRPRKPKATVSGRSGERGRAGRREPSSSTARPKRDEAQRRRASAGPRGPRFGSVARRAGVSRAALQTALPRRTLRSYPTAGSGGVDRPRASTRRGRSPPPGGAGREPPAALWPGTQRARSAGDPGQRPTAGIGLYGLAWFIYGLSEALRSGTIDGSFAPPHTRPVRAGREGATAEGAVPARTAVAASRMAVLPRRGPGPPVLCPSRRVRGACDRGGRGIGGIG